MEDEQKQFLLYKKIFGRINPQLPNEFVLYSFINLF